MPHTTPDSRRVILLAVAVALLTAGSASARTHAFPHVFDTKGRVSNTPWTFDTTMFITYSGDVACTGGRAVRPAGGHLPVR
jgi:hypothetical protein